jgi:hypothetical protein
MFLYFQISKNNDMNYQNENISEFNIDAKNNC